MNLAILNRTLKKPYNWYQYCSILVPLAAHIICLEVGVVRIFMDTFFLNSYFCMYSACFIYVATYIVKKIRKNK